MKPVELESQMNKLPSEEEFFNSFPSVVNDIMGNICEFDLDFRNSFFGGNLECASCNTRFSAGFYETIHLHNSLSENIRNVQDIADKVKEKLDQIHEKKFSDCKMFKLKTRTKKISYH